MVSLTVAAVNVSLSKLLVSDLTEPKILERFMGTEDALGFYRFHKPESIIKAA
jgi:hypothetical protein